MTHHFFSSHLVRLLFFFFLRVFPYSRRRFHVTRYLHNSIPLRRRTRWPYGYRRYGDERGRWIRWKSSYKSHTFFCRWFIFLLVEKRNDDLAYISLRFAFVFGRSQSLSSGSCCWAPSRKDKPVAVQHAHIYRLGCPPMAAWAAVSCTHFDMTWNIPHIYIYTENKARVSNSEEGRQHFCSMHFLNQCAHPVG